METIKAKITGTDQEIMVDVDLESNADKRLNDFLDTLIAEYANKATDELDEEELSEKEFNHLIERLSDSGESVDSPEDLIPAIVDGRFYNIIKATVDYIVNNRAKYFTFEVNYSGTIEVTVKANNEEAAKDLLEELDHYDLADFVDLTDTEFDVGDCIDVSDEEPCCSNVIDTIGG